MKSPTLPTGGTETVMIEETDIDQVAPHQVSIGWWIAGTKVTLFVHDGYLNLIYAVVSSHETTLVFASQAFFMLRMFVWLHTLQSAERKDMEKDLLSCDVTTKNAGEMRFTLGS